MSTPLIPQEIFLLERYSSVAYYEELRNHFAAMVKAAEDALGEFMRNLPPDYRNRPLNEQPDAVWGERVIPNLQWVLKGLNEGFIRMTHGDWEAMALAGNVEATFAAINRDYDSFWMPEPFQTIFDNSWRSVSRPASNINSSALGEWCSSDLTTDYTDTNRGPMNPPSSWPKYRLVPSVRVKTDDKVPRNGIYLPDIAGSCAQVLIEGYEAWAARILRNPDNRNSAASDDWPTTWTLVERIADTGGGTPGDPDPIKAGVRLRAMAGEVCPRTGYWFTPARQNSRAHFEAGQTMPDVGGTWGATIWQWDEQQ